MTGPHRARGSRKPSPTPPPLILAHERRRLVRETQDVIAHQLSNVALLVMAYRSSDNVGQLQDALHRIHSANEEALAELRLLERVLRDEPAGAAGSADVVDLGDRIPPTMEAERARAALAASGLKGHVTVDERVDSLEMTVQQTLSLAIREAVRNACKHAEPGAPVRLGVTVTADEATLNATHPLDPHAPVTTLDLGLQRLGQRADLTGGSLLLGLSGNTWQLVLRLPLRHLAGPGPLATHARRP